MACLFFDVDGTLVDRSVMSVPESAVIALKKAAKNGHKIFICSGRPPYALKSWQKKEYVTGVICNNGANIIFDGKDHAGVLVSPELIAAVITLTERYHCGLTLHGYENSWMNDYAYERMYSVLGNAKHIDVDFKVELFLPLAEHTEDVYKMEFFFHPEDDDESFMKEIRTYPLQVVRMLSVGGTKNGGETTMPDCTKGTAVEMVMKAYPGEVSYAFGDANNDIDMLNACDHPVAMGNGTEEVKAVAEYITTRIDENGIKNALEHFGLI